MQALQTLLAADVVVHADGGCKHSAALEPIAGLAAVLQLHAGPGRVHRAQSRQIAPSRGLIATSLITACILCEQTQALPHGCALVMLAFSAL